MTALAKFKWFCFTLAYHALPQSNGVVERDKQGGRSVIIGSASSSFILSRMRGSAFSAFYQIYSTVASLLLSHYHIYVYTVYQFLDLVRGVKVPKSSSKKIRPWKRKLLLTDSSGKNVEFFRQSKNLSEKLVDSNTAMYVCSITLWNLPKCTSFQNFQSLLKKKLNCHNEFLLSHSSFSRNWQTSFVERHFAATSLYDHLSNNEIRPFKGESKCKKSQMGLFTNTLSY